MRYFSCTGALAGGLALVLLAGCAQLGPSAPARPGGGSTAPVGGNCDAQGAQWAVGKGGTARVVEEARVRSGARMARVLHQGRPVTLEFDAQRLSLEVDGSGKVVAARCG